MALLKRKTKNHLVSGFAAIGIFTGTIGIISPASAATFRVSGIFNDGAVLSGTFELDQNGSPGNFSLTTTSGILPSEVYDPLLSPSGATVTLTESDTSFSLTFRPFEVSIPEIDKFLRLSFAGSPEDFTGGQGLPGGTEEDFDLNRTPTTILRTLVSYNAESVPVPESHSIVGMVSILSLGALLNKQRKTKN